MVTHLLLRDDSTCVPTWLIPLLAVLWCVKVQVDLLVSDPFGSVAAAFVPATPGSTTTHCK